VEPAATAIFLSGLPLFRYAPPESLARIEAATTRVELPAQDYLFRAGEPAAQLHVVLSGRLEVVAQDGTVLREVGPGSVLGELAVLTGSARSASVRARRDAELVAVEGVQFQALLRSDPALAFALLRELSHELQQSAGIGSVEAPPAVFTVLAPGAGAAAACLWRALVDAFGELGSVAALEGPPDGGRPFAETLARLEATHDRVLLLGDGPPEWRSFATRQADRIVVLAGAWSPPRGESHEGAELVLCESVPASSIGEWLDALRPRAHHLVEPQRVNEGARRAARRMAGRSLGVVLSGGGARGAAHIGVLAVLGESGFEVDRVGGCSIGSFVGAMAAAGWDPQRMRDVWREELALRSPFSDYTVPRASLIRGRRAEAMLRRVFGELALEELPRSFFTVSADLVSSDLVVHRRGPAWEAVGTSMAIPGLAPPQRRGGRLLVDGGLLDNLPVDVMAAAGEGPVVAVDVVRKPGRQDEDAEELPLPSIMETLARATVLGSAESLGKEPGARDADDRASGAGDRAPRLLAARPGDRGWPRGDGGGAGSGRRRAAARTLTCAAPMSRGEDRPSPLERGSVDQQAGVASVRPWCASLSPRKATDATREIAICSDFSKPSDGLEPSTPSL
jgi:NTE family protein